MFSLTILCKDMWLGLDLFITNVMYIIYDIVNHELWEMFEDTNGINWSTYLYYYQWIDLLVALYSYLCKFTELQFTDICYFDGILIFVGETRTRLIKKNVIILHKHMKLLDHHNLFSNEHVWSINYWGLYHATSFLDLLVLITTLVSSIFF